MKSAYFIMLYTEDFVLRYYVGFGNIYENYIPPKGYALEYKIG